MTRRELAALTSAAILSGAERSEAQVDRDLYELRAYTLDDTQRDPFCQFLGRVAAPALQRLGRGPVGLFEKRDGTGQVWALLRHDSLASILGLETQLLADQAYQRDGGAIVDAVNDTKAYQELDRRLLLAFEGMPTLEQPVTGDGRVYQLRIYESPSVKTGLKKIEMFNTAEIAIFRDCGMHPVIFGQAILGGPLPNLTYLLGFESAEAQKAAWGKFRTHPEWLKLRAMPEYADQRIIRKITNLDLRPLPGSEL